LKIDKGKGQVVEQGSEDGVEDAIVPGAVISDNGPPFQHILEVHYGQAGKELTSNLSLLMHSSNCSANLPYI